MHDWRIQSGAELSHSGALPFVALVLGLMGVIAAAPVQGAPPASSTSVRGVSATPLENSGFDPRRTASRSVDAPSSLEYPQRVASIAATTSEPGLTGATPLTGSEMLARIAGEVVLASDVLWQVNQLIHINRDKIPPDKVEETRRMLLRQQVMGLIDTKLLFADFRRTVPAENFPKVESSLEEPFEKTEIPRLIEIFKARDRAELSETLKSHGTSISDVKRQFVEKTIAGEWLRQRVPKARPVTHEEMLEYFHQHTAEYAIAPRIRYEELMVRFDRMESREAAWSELANMGNDVWRQASAIPGARGPLFAKVAAQRSHGFTAAQGGVNEIDPGALQCDALNDALATLEIGQMSDGIESELGFHLVRVLERKSASQRPFTEVQGEIREKLEGEQRKVAIEKEINELRRDARVWTVFDGDLSGLRLFELLNGPKRR